MASTNIHEFTVQEKLNKMDVDLIEVELTTTAGSHADGTIIATAEIVSNVASSSGAGLIVQSIVLINTDDSVESPAFDLVFGQDDTTLGSVGSVPSITDANLINWCQGIVNISNWLTIKANNSEVATKTNVGLVLKPTSTSKNIYVNVINSSGAAYTPGTTSALRMLLGVVKD